MRRIRSLLIIGAAACSSRTQPPTPDPPASQLTGARPNHMRNCPSAIRSAVTTTTPTPDGIDLTITSTDPAARDQILALARLHSRQRDSLSVVPPHSSLHGGPGSIGFCPIVHANTMVTFTAVPGGALLHVMANDRDQITALRNATAKRLDALRWPSS